MGRLIRSAALVSTASNGRMMKRVFACKVIAAACLVAATGIMAAAAAERLPRSFHGTWASDLAQCAETGELTPTRIDGRSILQYESGWSIRTWTRRGNVWVGRGRAFDDQGSTPATVRLRLRADGRLNFDSTGSGPMPDDAGWVRCPAETGSSSATR